jgi:hypothetical protein
LRQTLTRAVFTDQWRRIALRRHTGKFCFRFNDLLELVLRAIDGEPPSCQRAAATTFLDH